MTEPLILLPGMMCDERLFKPQLTAIGSTQGSTRKLIVMPLTGSSSVKELACEILTQAPPRFALLGLSMGGIVAMEMIRQCPERISRLALLDTNPLADTPQRQDIRDQQIARAKAGELRAIMRDEMKPHYLAELENKNETLNLCMAMAESLGSQVFIEQSSALQTRPDQCETLKTINVPTLIACGEHDTLCPLKTHQLMHELITDSQLSVIAEAGHLPTLEQPQLINQEIIRWLNL